MSGVSTVGRAAAYQVSYHTSRWAAGSPPWCILRPGKFRGAKPDQSAEASSGAKTTSPFSPASGGALLYAFGAGAAVTLTLENGSLSRYPSNLLKAACCWSQDCCFRRRCCYRFHAKCPNRFMCQEARKGKYDRVVVEYCCTRTCFIYHNNTKTALNLVS